jgi:excinuclease ABC subunit A
MKNSVVAVDHSSIIAAAADHLIELGPGSGPAGGEIVFQGSPAEWQRSQKEAPEALSSNTASAQSSRPDRKSKRAPSSKSISLSGITCRNFKTFSCQFALNRFIVVTGRSGSGKTTLVTSILYPAICKHIGVPSSEPMICDCELQVSKNAKLVEAVLVDQTPLTASLRSNPAMWLEVFDGIRQTFAETADARQRGFTAQYFSFNSTAGGRCRACRGTGHLKQDMQFLPDLTLDCPECNGTRYRREILEVKYRGRSIADVLMMSVSEAAIFFRSQPRIQQKFQWVKQIGLDYLTLGQSSNTLSGGEAQRLKLATRLATPPIGAALILCDDPTAGLHASEVKRLVDCFHDLTENGHTVVVADTNPELIAAADDVLELQR